MAEQLLLMRRMWRRPCHVCAICPGAGIQGDVPSEVIVAGLSEGMPAVLVGHLLAATPLRVHTAPCGGPDHRPGQRISDS
jgi:hypothetical protein